MKKKKRRTTNTKFEGCGQCWWVSSRQQSDLHCNPAKQTNICVFLLLHACYSIRYRYGTEFRQCSIGKDATGPARYGSFISVVFECAAYHQSIIVFFFYSESHDNECPKLTRSRMSDWLMSGARHLIYSNVAECGGSPAFCVSGHRNELSRAIPMPRKQINKHNMRMNEYPFLRPHKF